MSKKKSPGFDAQYDRAYFFERMSLTLPHWQDAAEFIDLYEEEVDAGEPDVMDRLILGDACLALLIDADAFKNKERRLFVERVVGPTWPIDLFAIKSDVVEFRDWAVARIIEEEAKEAARTWASAPPSSPQADDLF